MSKRITFTDFEIEQLIAGIKVLRNESNLNYQVIKVGQNFYDALLEKLLPTTKAKRNPNER